MTPTISKFFVVWLPIFAITFILAVSVLSGSWLQLLMTASGIGYVLFTLFDPLNGLLVWILTSPYISSYIKISLPAGIPDVTFERVAVGSILLGLLLQFKLKTRQLVPFGVIEKVMLLFIAIGCVSVIFKSDNIGQYLLIFFDEYGIPFLLFVAAKNLFHSHDNIKKLQQVLFLLGLFFALHGIYQYLTHSTTDVNLGYDPAMGIHLSKGRAVGPFLNAVEYGGVLVITFLWTLYLALFDSQGLKRYLLIIGTGLMGLGVFVSLTRSVWLGFFASLLTIQIFKQHWRKILVTSIVGLTCVFLLISVIVPETYKFSQRAEEIETVYMRLVMYKAALVMSLAKPVFGYGVSKRAFVTGRKDYLSSVGSISAEWGDEAGPPHNQLLYILVQYGLLGVLPYIAIFYLIIKYSLNLIHQFPDKRSPQYQFVIFFWGTLAAYVMQGLFVDVDALLFLSSLFYIIAGVFEGFRYRIFLQNETTAIVRLQV